MGRKESNQTNKQNNVSVPCGNEGVETLGLLNLWYRRNTWPMFKEFGIVRDSEGI